MAGSALVLVANAGDGSISTFAATADGLDRLAVSPLGAKCSTFAIDAERDLVYAGVGGGNPEIVTLRLDRTTGQLTDIGRHRVADSPTYLALNAAGTVLAGAFYHSGVGTAWSIADGTLTDGPDRIEYPNVHCVAISPDQASAYFVSLGADQIVHCRLGEDASLENLGETAAPARSGPRHLILNRAGTSAYVVTEFTAEVLHYKRAEDGSLTLGEQAPIFHPDRSLTLSTFGADPRAEHLVWGADLHLSHDESHLWCSERTESTIATIPVRPDGTIGDPIAFADVEEQPRGFCVLHDGRVLVTGERSTTVSLYNVAEGKLVRQDQAETGKGANWARPV
ncbi:MAG: beta-propeller fold lactonase family protein [Micropruina sp.]|nr:MAG: beta-propeller fold lactonase family protein [Micropruina sp.]